MQEMWAWPWRNQEEGGLAAPTGTIAGTTWSRGLVLGPWVKERDTWIHCGMGSEAEEEISGEGGLLAAIAKEFSLLKVPCETPLITRVPHCLQRKIKFS